MNLERARCRPRAAENRVDHLGESANGAANAHQEAHQKEQGRHHAQDPVLLEGLEQIGPDRDADDQANESEKRRGQHAAEHHQPLPQGHPPGAVGLEVSG